MISILSSDSLSRLKATFFQRSHSFLDYDEGMTCNHELSTSADDNATASASKCHLSANSSMSVVRNFAIWLFSRVDTWARLLNVSIKDAD